MAYEQEREALLRRLARIEGQVRGLQRMIEEERYCVDVLTQLAATRQALRQVSLILLRSHLETCVIRAIQQENPRAVEELMAVLGRFEVESE